MLETVTRVSKNARLRENAREFLLCSRGAFYTTMREHSSAAQAESVTK